MAGSWDSPAWLVGSAVRPREVVIHGDDLAASIGNTTWRADPDAAALAVETLITVARQNHGDHEVIRALARRERAALGVLPVL